MRLPVACLTLALLAGPAFAEVFVLGNTQTGQVVIRGNRDDAGLDASREAKGIRETGWVQLFADDTPGWGAISCVKTDKGVQFSLSSGHKTELEAVRLAKAGADKMQLQSGGVLMFMCAPRWNNYGQPIAFGSDGMNNELQPAEKAGIVDQALGAVQGSVRKEVTKDYRRDCVPPPQSARAELAPLERGVVQPKDTRPPARTWKPADWCPRTLQYPASGKRG